MNTLDNAGLASSGSLVIAARQPARESRQVGIVWARGACRQALGLEILHDLLRTRGVRSAVFSCEKQDVLRVDYDARYLNTAEILVAVCRPGVWARFVGA